MSGARAKSALTGARKAAILLTVLGEEAAALVCTVGKELADTTEAAE